MEVLNCALKFLPRKKMRAKLESRVHNRSIRSPCVYPLHFLGKGQHQGQRNTVNYQKGKYPEGKKNHNFMHEILFAECALKCTCKVQCVWTVWPFVFFGQVVRTTPSACPRGRLLRLCVCMCDSMPVLLHIIIKLQSTHYRCAYP